MISHLTFNYLIHFYFIFEYGMKKQSSLIILHVALQLSKYHLLKRTFLPPLLYVMTYVSVGSFSLFCSTDLRVCFCFWLL